MWIKVTGLHELYLNSVEVTLGHRIIMYIQLRQMKDNCVVIIYATGQNLKS